VAEFVVEVAAESSAPAVGSTPPASENRTLATVPDLSKITSDLDPAPGLYEMTVADAMASGRPTVVSFATPRFCTSRLCAPVVDSLAAVQEEMGEEVNIIHIEVFEDFETLEPVKEMAEWGLISEPWTFVLDREGVIIAKFGGPVSPRELTESLTEEV
jgi:hypothetical protein